MFELDVVEKQTKEIARTSASKEEPILEIVLRRKQ